MVWLFPEQLWFEFAQDHRDGLLRGRKCGLKLMWRVAAILDAVALAPLIAGLWGNSEAVCKDPSSRHFGLNGGPHLRRRRGLLVEMDQYGRTPFRIFLRINFTLKSADRRGKI